MTDEPREENQPEEEVEAHSPPVGLPPLNDPPLKIVGAAAHWVNRIDDDHSSSRAISSAKLAGSRQTLFDNAARQVGGAAKHIQERHISPTAQGGSRPRPRVPRGLGR